LTVDEKQQSKDGWRLQPGKMLLIDNAGGRIILREEVKSGTFAGEQPYRDGLNAPSSILEDLKAG